MRKRMGNTFFTILYPGLHPESTADQYERDKMTSIAITRSGEFVSIGTKEGCAVFYTSKELRELADALHEAADIFDEYKVKPVVR